MTRTNLCLWALASSIVLSCLTRQLPAQQLAIETRDSTQRATSVGNDPSPWNLPSEYDSGVPDPGLVDILDLPDELKAAKKPEPVGGLTELKIQEFDFEYLEDLLTLWLDTGCTGYNFSVYRSGVEVASGSGGSARLPVDGPEIAYTKETRQEIASMTKTFTAMAVLQALDDQGQSPNFTQIEDYLPSFWVKGPGVAQITVAGLLSHHSGLLDQDTSPDDALMGNLMQTIEDGCVGPVGPHDGFFYDYSYENSNYGLAVYVLAYLVAPDTMADFEQQHSDAAGNGLVQAAIRWNMDDFVHECYLDYVRANILAPSDVTTDIDVFDWDSTSTDVRYYNFADPSIAGVSNDDNTMTSGPRGLVMRSQEVAKVMSALEKAQNVNSQVRTWMKDMEMGLDEYSAGGQTFYFKNGGNTYSNNRGRETILVLCPSDVQIVVNMNSRNNAWGMNVAGFNRIDFISAFYLASME